MEPGQFMHPDARHQAIFQRLSRTIPHIRCPSDHRVVQLCINPLCRNALKCNDESCRVCGPRIHDGCLTISLERVTRLVNRKTEEWKEQIMDVFSIQEELIDRVRKSQEEFLKVLMERQMTPEEIHGIKIIYEHRNYNAMSGQQANILCHQLQNALKVDIGDKLKEYKRALEKEVEHISNIRAACFLADVKQIQKEGAIMPYKREEMFPRQSIYNGLSEQQLFRMLEHQGYQKLMNHMEDEYTELIDVTEFDLGPYSCFLMARVEWPYLQKLYLGWNSIGNQGCKYLTRGQWPSLNLLNLDGNNIDRKGCEVLLDGRWPSLKHLSLVRNKINQKCWHYLRGKFEDKMHGLWIQWY